MADNKKLLVVYRDMPESVLTEDVDIILTPQFYTVKKEALPIKYGFQAKRIAVSIFEGMLDEDKHYEYFVFKEAEEWVFIAYCMDYILHFLESKHINISLIGRIFFAQQFAQNFQAPYALGDHEVLTVLDHTVVMLPKTVVEDETISSIFDQTFKPKQGIVINEASALIFNKKQVVMLASFFLFMAVLYFIEGNRYNDSSGTMVQKYEALIQSNPVLEDQYKRESILSKYEKIDKTERFKREMIKTLGSIITKGVTLESIKLDDKGFKAYMIVQDVLTRRKIESIAKAENLKVSKPDSASGIYVEGKL